MDEEDSQFTEWHDVFVTISRIRRGEISELEAWDILSKKYVLVEVVELNNFLKTI